ncbi:hypothetical protein ACIBF1_00650 [Spirillospora sp. NPDC050679]
MILRRLGYVALVLVLVFYVVRDPAGAARTVKLILAALATLADALGRFASAF